MSEGNENEYVKQLTGSAGANMIFVVGFLVYRALQNRCTKKKVNAQRIVVGAILRSKTTAARVILSRVTVNPMKTLEAVCPKCSKATIENYRRGIQRLQNLMSEKSLNQLRLNTDGLLFKSEGKASSAKAILIEGSGTKSDGHPQVDDNKIISRKIVVPSGVEDKWKAAKIMIQNKKNEEIQSSYKAYYAFK